MVHFELFVIPLAQESVKKNFFATNKCLSTQRMTTDFIEPARIERGEAPGWVQLSANQEIAISVMLSMGYVDLLPETAEEIKVPQDPAAG